MFFLQDPYHEKQGGYSSIRTIPFARISNLKKKPQGVRLHVAQTWVSKRQIVKVLKKGSSTVSGPSFVAIGDIGVKAQVEKNAKRWYILGISSRTVGASQATYFQHKKKVRRTSWRVMCHPNIYTLVQHNRDDVTFLCLMMNNRDLSSTISHEKMPVYSFTSHTSLNLTHKVVVLNDWKLFEWGNISIKLRLFHYKAVYVNDWFWSSFALIDWL